jgi:hypothetical protein
VCVFVYGSRVFDFRVWVGKPMELDQLVEMGSPSTVGRLYVTGTCRGFDAVRLVRDHHIVRHSKCIMSNWRSIVVYICVLRLFGCYGDNLGIAHKLLARNR